jgi:hypothetical protein
MHKVLSIRQPLFIVPGGAPMKPNHILNKKLVCKFGAQTPDDFGLLSVER